MNYKKMGISALITIALSAGVVYASNNIAAVKFLKDGL